jgi:TolA-binding protein
VSVVDLHPEELLDKQARGTLSASEASLLEAHLARCATCRAEKLLRADFADELDEPLDERPSLSELLEGVAALRTKTPRDETPAEVDLSAEAPEREAPKSMPVPRRRAVTGTAWLLVAAAMLAVSAATGATQVGKQVWTRVVAVVTTIDTAPAPTASPAPKREARPAAPAPAPVEAVAPAPTVQALAAPASIEPAPSETGAPHTPEAPRAPRAAVRPRTAPPAPDAEAAALFDAAATARRRGDYGQAIALHRDLLARFPRTREAQTSRATVGRLLLDRGDPSGALASFDAYMTAGSGELGEEAMAGRATALERLGRSDDARRAWEALLAAYPSTPYATHARARVDAASEAIGR